MTCSYTSGGKRYHLNPCPSVYTGALYTVITELTGDYRIISKKLIFLRTSVN